MTSTKLQILALAVMPSLIFAASARAAEASDTNSVTVTPGVRYISVGGDYQRFRQLNLMKEHLTGGIENFTLDQRTAKNLQVHAEGHILFEEQDYKLQLDITKPEAWFLRTSFSQYRKYYDNSGGVYSFAGYPAKSFSLGRDLYLNIGNFTVDFGLTLPNLPQITLGYERQYKDGSKSLTSWSRVTGPSSVSRNIYPTDKGIQENVDIIKLAIEHDIKNIHLANDFRYEHYQNNTTRDESGTVTLPAIVPTSVSTYKEDFGHDAFFNTFLAESHLNEKIYWSLGYMFTTLNGNDTLFLSPARNTSVGIDQYEHIINASAMFGPFGGLTANCGIQGTMNDTAAQGTGANSSAFIQKSDYSENSLEENIGLRYTKIPYTTLYADASFYQGTIDVNEQQSLSSAWTRRLDTVVNKEDVKVGFNTSPLTKMTLSGYYRYKNTDNDYQNSVDSGSRAIIAEQMFETHEVGTKLTIRPLSRLSLSLKYQFLSTTTETTSMRGPTGVYNQLTASESGQYDSQIYTVSATVTPIDRLYVTGLFSYQNATTWQNDYLNPIVQTFIGDVYSAMGSFGYAIDSKTDISGDYSVSWARNNQANATIALPYGANYTQHAATVTLSRQLSPRVRAQLRYGYYQFDEDASMNVNDYTAHMLMASCAIRF